MLQVAPLVCLTTHSGVDAAWTWHARFSHMNFKSLRKLARQDMVHGLPLVEYADQIYDNCLAGKQRHVSFAHHARYRAEDQFELVHGDLYGSISPATRNGKKYFLLLVDDATRYMWIALLASKDEAPAAIQHIQAGAESDSGCQLRMLRTDRSGECSRPDPSPHIVPSLALGATSPRPTRPSRTASSSGAA